MQDKLLSIIIPVYNVESYLDKCIDSIVASAKEYKSKMEILLIDDGSTDNSSAICDKLAEKYEFVNVFHQLNAGVSGARNTGIMNAKGEFITFADSDDYFTNGFDSLFEKLESNKNVEIFSCGLIRNSNNISIFEEKLLNPQVYNDLYWIVSHNVTISCCAKVLNRKFVIDNKLYFLSGIKSEDNEWSIRLLSFAKKYMLLNLAYYIYFDRPTSVTHTITLVGYKDHFKNMQRIYETIENKSFKTTEKKRILFCLFEGNYHYLTQYRLANSADKQLIKEILVENKKLFIRPHKFSNFILFILIKVFGIKFVLAILSIVRF